MTQVLRVEKNDVYCEISFQYTVDIVLSSGISSITNTDDERTGCLMPFSIETNRVNSDRQSWLFRDCLSQNGEVEKRRRDKKRFSISPVNRHHGFKGLFDFLIQVLDGWCAARNLCAYDAIGFPEISEYQPPIMAGLKKSLPVVIKPPKKKSMQFSSQPLESLNF
jgi:hypothetical protein